MLASVILRAIQQRDVAELRRIRQTPEVVAWWAGMDEEFPFDEPDSTCLAVEVDGVVVGQVQFWEETDPQYRHAAVDVFIDPARHGQGIGTEAVRMVVRHLIADRGHHRVTIDPATANTAAVRAYEKAGFKPVGVMRQHERDADGTGWHDSLLMELLADEWETDGR